MPIFPGVFKRPSEEVINFLIHLWKIILCLKKLMNHWLVTITHDPRLKFSPFFSANFTSSAGQRILTFLASELWDAHFNCAKNKLPVHVAVKLLTWKRPMRSPELLIPGLEAWPPLKWGSLGKMFVFLDNTKEREEGKENTGAGIVMWRSCCSSQN